MGKAKKVHGALCTKVNCLSQLEMDNFIIHQQARQYQWSGDCFLSVKSFYNGLANYNVGYKDYCINHDSFLVLNECTKYDLTIDTANETESFCVFFSPEFVSGVVSEHCSSDIQLLDFNPNTKQKGIHFLERKYKHEGLVSSWLLEGKKRLSNSKSTLEHDEFYHQLLNALIAQNGTALKEAEKLSLKKKSTRVEIYQRIYCARDFIDNNYRANPTLSDIARVAALSENHLLRCFKQVFGLSPFKYLSKLRIQEACRQIGQTDKPISEIAKEVGYSSMSNFSHYFKSVTGKAPSCYKLGDI